MAAHSVQNKLKVGIQALVFRREREVRDIPLEADCIDFYVAFRRIGEIGCIFDNRIGGITRRILNPDFGFTFHLGIQYHQIRSSKSHS